jgi:intracellular septation protein A
MKLAAYRRPFVIDGLNCEVVTTSRMTGMDSELRVAGTVVATDRTPPSGPDAVRNHQLRTTLSDGTELDVEAGYVNWLTTGVAVRRGGVLVYESHPGRKIAWPEKAARMVTRPGTGDGAVDPTAWKRNRVPIAVDIALGLLFFLVAKATDLSTAAIVGAAAGLALVVIQRFVKVDLIGGLALFGVAMLLISAGLAILFQDDLAVKMRSTIVGSISALLFLTDGLFGGKWLGKGLARYLPYTDIHVGRLAIGMGILGLIMAALNTAVAFLASTDTWLFYTTFLDMPLVFLMIFAVFHYARRPVAPPRGAL